jgi:hypothetical protein
MRSSILGGAVQLLYDEIANCLNFSDEDQDVFTVALMSKAGEAAPVVHLDEEHFMKELGSRHFGWILGSPPGVPGGGITGVLPPPLGGTEMPGSIPAGGQITPLDWES